MKQEISNFSEEIQKKLHELANLPQGERYILLNDLAIKGFVITIKLSTDADGILHESILFQSKAEAEASGH